MECVALEHMNRDKTFHNCRLLVRLPVHEHVQSQNSAIRVLRHAVKMGRRGSYFLSLGAAHVAEICSTFVAVNTARPFSVVVFPVSLTV